MAASKKPARKRMGTADTMARKASKAKKASNTQAVRMGNRPVSGFEVTRKRYRDATDEAVSTKRNRKEVLGGGIGARTRGKGYDFVASRGTSRQASIAESRDMQKQQTKAQKARKSARTRKS